MSSAYFNCVGGASGDMVLGALLDAGLGEADLAGLLAQLKVGGWSLKAEPGARAGVSGTLARVELEVEGRRPRDWRELDGIVQASDLPEAVVSRSRAVLRRLAEAEAAAHRTAIEDVHLHELGTIDTIIDVVGAVGGLHLLGVRRVYCSPMPSGSGLARGGHGVLPVPAPATAALMAMAGAPVVAPPGGPGEAGEMVTPTGAAILTTLATFRQPPMRLRRVGYGLGARDPAQYPNVLALWLGEELGAGYSDRISMLETNVDDTTAQVLGYVHERLMQLGALDVWFTPVQMKKGRPGTMLSALVPSELESRAVDLMLRETSTLGVRVRPVSRFEAPREVVEVETSLGRVRVKVKRLDGAPASATPEYEDCRRIAAERGMPLQDVLRVVQREAESRLLKP